VNDIRIVVIFESSYIKYTKLPQALINIVKVILNVVVEVSHVECMLMHNPTPLEISLVRLVFIPDLFLPLCLEQLVSPSVDSLLEAVGITEMELPPQLSTDLSKVAFWKIFRLVKLGPSVILVEIRVHVVYRYCNRYRTPPVP
jgi:hypothetical protein